jgi:hypothetical protein
MVLETLGKPPGSKLIRLRAELEGDRIRSIRIRGDFFASPEEAFDRLEGRLAGTSLADLASAFDALLREEGIEVFGISGEGIVAVLAAGLAVGPDTVLDGSLAEKGEGSR